MGFRISTVFSWLIYTSFCLLPTAQNIPIFVNLVAVIYRKLNQK